MDKPIFQLKSVRYAYLGKFPALADITLTVTEGQKVVLIGQNGSGKSSLLTMLDGLIFPDEGSIRAFGCDLKEVLEKDERFARAFRRRVGFVFQNPEVQLFCPTVREDIIFGPLQLGIGRKETERRLDALTASFDLGTLLERPPYHLSIGEKKKVAIASVLAIDPEVLLLDEPTAGLDPRTTRDIVDSVLAHHAKGKTVVIATHDLHIAAEIADSVQVLSREKTIVRSGAPHTILADQHFLQEHNLVHIHRHRHEGTSHTHIHQHWDHHA